MNRGSFIFYASFYEAMKCLDETNYNAVSRAINEYALYGTELELDGVAKGFFQLIKPQIDANNRRRDNGLKGGAPQGNSNAKKQPKTTEKQPKNNQETTENQPKNNLKTTENQPKTTEKQPNVNDNVNDNISNNISNNSKSLELFSNGIDIEKEKKKILKEKNKNPSRFVPPTIDEVAEYCRQRNSVVDPQGFVDYYTANGWKVGKNSMKNWQAAIRLWERKEAEKAPPHPQPQLQLTTRTEIDEQGNTIAVWPDGTRARLGIGEYINAKGEREYNKQLPSVPRMARPRPGRDYFFNRESNTWTTA